jgi:16S rRNA (uracil1498-N3)-methyltransferase
MPRIFLPELLSDRDTITVSGDKARYLSTVLRCNKGDTVIIIDAHGTQYSAEISRISKKEILLNIMLTLDYETESSLRITLLQGIMKGQKMDLIVQKASELGVQKIIPVVTERSLIRQTRKLARWRKIAEEASRQSGRRIVTEINEFLDFQHLCDGRRRISGKGILFWEEGGERLSAVLKKVGSPPEITLFVGPEGGFTQKEVKTIAEKGYSIATLGKRILRAETAAISAVSIIQYELGDL